MDDKVVYTLCERVDAKNAAQVQQEMDELSGDGSCDFVIDFKDNKYISSAGLRALTVVQKKMRAAAGSFVLRNVNDSLRDLLDVTGLSGYLPIE